MTQAETLAEQVKTQVLEELKGRTAPTPEALEERKREAEALGAAMREATEARAQGHKLAARVEVLEAQVQAMQSKPAAKAARKKAASKR